MRKNTFKLKKIMLAGVLALVGLFSVVFGSLAPAKVNAAVGDWYETEIDGVYNVDGDLYLGSDYENIFYKKTYKISSVNTDSFTGTYTSAVMGENGFESITINIDMDFSNYYFACDLYNESETIQIILNNQSLSQGDDIVKIVKNIYKNYNFGYYCSYMQPYGTSDLYPAIDQTSSRDLISNAYPGEVCRTFTLTDYYQDGDLTCARVDHAVSTDMNSGDFEAENTFFPCGKYLWNEILLPQTQTITPDQTEYETSFMTAFKIYFETFSTVTDVNDTIMCYEIMGDQFPVYSFRAQAWFPWDSSINADQYRIFEYVWDGSDEIWQQDALALTPYFWEAFEEVPIFIKNNAQQLIKLYKEPEEPEEPPAPPIEPPTAEPDPKAITYGIIIFVILLAAAVFVLSSKSKK